MLPRFRLPALAALGLTLAGCASHRAVAPVAVAPPPAPVAYAAMPPFASPGMKVPAVLPDGRYPTPSDGLSEPAALWHLRAALNVAALTCRDGALTAQYNALISGHAAMLGTAHGRYAAEFQTAPMFDAAMTRLYNFYVFYPARTGFCGASARTLADLAPLSDSELAASAPDALATLDRPFTDFYHAYDAWRRREPAAMTAVALVAAIPPAPRGVPRIELASGAVFAGDDHPAFRVTDDALTRQ